MTKDYTVTKFNVRERDNRVQIQILEAHPHHLFYVSIYDMPFPGIVTQYQYRAGSVRAGARSYAEAEAIARELYAQEACLSFPSTHAKESL
jgi:hypothetical protein